MHAAQISTTNALGAFLTVVAAHPLLERLFFASVELAVLAVLVFAAIYIGRIRSARLASILWLLVLAKPLVSLAIGSPVPLVRMPVPEVAAVVPAPEPKLEQVTPQPPLETPKPHDRQPDADDMGQAVFEPQMQPQLPADVTPAQTMLKPTAAEPIVAESSVPGPQRGPVPSNVPTIMLAVWLCGVAALTGARLHIAHMSTLGSLEYVRLAKRRGLAVTCEVTPHHFTLIDEDVVYDTNFKMNPPWRHARIAPRSSRELQMDQWTRSEPITRRIIRRARTWSSIAHHSESRDSRRHWRSGWRNWCRPSGFR